MSPLRLNGSTSGFSQLDAPAIAGDQTFTLPGTGGTIDRLNRAGNILQVVNFQTGAYASGTTTIPADDTIPQSTEGTEFMTLAITPTNASSKLLIFVTAALSSSATTNFIGALFQDSTANSLASKAKTTNSTFFENLDFIYYMTAGTTSATTFKFRAGGSGVSTMYFNGVGSRAFGGVSNSSITITEIAA